MFHWDVKGSKPHEPKTNIEFRTEKMSIESLLFTPLCVFPSRKKGVMLGTRTYLYPPDPRSQDTLFMFPGIRDHSSLSEGLRDHSFTGPGPGG